MRHESTFLNSRSFNNSGFNSPGSGFTPSAKPPARVTGLYQPLPPVPAPEARWALFLDVDGTLIELAETPDAVHVSRELIAQLERMRQCLDGALALISGRSIAQLDDLFAPLQLACAGQHGLERRGVDGSVHTAAIDAQALHTLHTAAARLGAKMPEVIIENKGMTVAFHYRQARLQQPALRAELEHLAQSSGFSLQAGRDVYELKASHLNKGTALQDFLNEAPFAQRLPIYLGDDLTDEHALAVAQRYLGMGIQVGSRMPSAALFGLPDPKAVVHWLHRWEEQFT